MTSPAPVPPELFERFVRGFFAKHYPSCTADEVHAFLRGDRPLSCAHPDSECAAKERAAFEAEREAFMRAHGGDPA